MGFAKIVVKGKRKITYLTFVKGIKELAKRSKQSADSLFALILKAGGPTARGTKAADVRWAKKENFTGVATRGGPSTIDLNPNATGLSGLLDRTENDVRGRKVTNGPQKHKGTRVSRQNSVVDTPAVAGKVSRQNSESRLARTDSATGPADTAI